MFWPGCGVLGVVLVVAAGATWLRSSATTKAMTATYDTSPSTTQPGRNHPEPEQLNHISPSPRPRIVGSRSKLQHVRQTQSSGAARPAGSLPVCGRAALCAAARTDPIRGPPRLQTPRGDYELRPIAAARGRLGAQRDTITTMLGVARPRGVSRDPGP